MVGVGVVLKEGGKGAMKEEMVSAAEAAAEEEEGRVTARLARGEGVDEERGRARVWVGRP